MIAQGSQIFHLPELTGSLTTDINWALLMEMGLREVKAEMFENEVFLLIRTIENKCVRSVSGCCVLKTLCQLLTS